MKLNQAWTWLVAGVMAAGVNASYHNGDLQRMHRVAEEVEHSTGAVLALASGRADQFLAIAQLLMANRPAASSQLSVQLAEVSDSGTVHFSEAPVAIANQTQAKRETISACAQAREDVRMAKLQAQRDLLQADRDRIEAEVAKNLTRAQMETASFRRVDFPGVVETLNMIPAKMVPAEAMKHFVCLRQRAKLRSNVPQIPAVHVPELSFDAPAAGPV